MLETTQINAQKWTEDTLNMEGFENYLRRAFPQSTTYHVGSLTGISSSTVRNWLEGVSKPSGEHFATLVCLFGPSFLSACISKPQDWILKAAEHERKLEIEREIDALRNERDRLTA